MLKCPTCKGLGTLFPTAVHYLPPTKIPIVSVDFGYSWTCPTCQGTGEITKEKYEELRTDTEEE